MKITTTDLPSEAGRWETAERPRRVIPTGALFSFKTTPHRDCAVRFFVRLYRDFAVILAYGKKPLCKMAKNMQTSCVQSHKAFFVRYCLNSIFKAHEPCVRRFNRLRKNASINPMTAHTPERTTSPAPVYSVGIITSVDAITTPRIP